ncbi:ATP-dependent helicase [Fibrobacter sp. UWEL]|uniref:ATP-dependent helicase n=1 Tax=Fibrobacter sp. UWEL TaxID=1896209 RepID=UPI00091C6C56|nr:UvrD-helicase domain-containing protein [Fibrobacter sp. UWEL]SHK34474.1 DNA helicase-2 / ATP-dependent DNA helicase PcrA [Fibrobacter sp. UWEL]
MNKLDAEQREAVENTEGFVRVIAGAGSGKTRTLTQRYLYLAKELGISPSNILCVTFTNKAAGEMKSRIRTMLKGDDSGYISTFHGFCVQFLREDIHVLNYPKEFMILDEDDQKALLKKSYAELGLHLNDLKISSVMDFIGGRKANETDYVSLFAEKNGEDLLELIESAPDKWHKVYYRYLYEQRKNFALDFDDLILVTLYILKRFPEKLEKWSKRMMYIMVDEFQDIDGQQYQLAELLSSYHKNLFVVGDPDQTIYTWRGADVNRILDFDRHHEGCKTILLQNNYRSTPSILKVPDSVIKNNEFRIEKVLRPMRSGGKTPVFYHAKNTRKEAEWIVERIQQAVENGVDYKDIAVLYRMHSQSRSVEEALMSKEIPYKVYSGIGFYQRQEVKDVLCYLRILVYGDDLSFMRVVNTPKRMFGPKKQAILQNYAASRGLNLYDALLEIYVAAAAEDAAVENETVKPDLDCSAFMSRTKVGEFVQLIEKYRSAYKDMAVSDVLTKMLRESGYEEMLRLDGDDDRLSNLAELKQGVMEFEKNFEEDATLDEYLQNIVLFTNADVDSQVPELAEGNGGSAGSLTLDRKNKIQLMTIHNAKGLEFPYVFVCGLNEGCFPVKRVKNKVQLEEERRLAYVALTRAENVLCMSDSEDSAGGDVQCRYPSRFLLEMNMDDLDIVQGFSDEWYRAAKQHIAEVDRNRELGEGLNLDDSGVDGVSGKKAPVAKFAEGDRVVHKIMGAGTIVGIDAENFYYEIKFDKIATHRAIQFDYPLEAE